MTTEKKEIKNIYQRLANFRIDVKGKLTATGNNTYKGYVYATIDDIKRACDDALSANGLALYHQVNQENKTLKTTLINIESVNEFLETEFPLLYDVNDPQKAGSALTYARRYNINCLLDLDAKGDDDGVGAIDRNKPPAPLPKQPEYSPINVEDILYDLETVKNKEEYENIRQKYNKDIQFYYKNKKDVFTQLTTEFQSKLKLIENLNNKEI